MTSQALSVSNSSHIVLSTQSGPNATALRELLEAQALICVSAPTVEAVADAIATEAALVVVTEEVLADRQTAKRLSECLSAQPDWSDIPLIVLLKDCRRFAHCLSLLSDTAHHRSVLLLELPLKRQVFMSMVLSCLRNRQRQYALRDTLHQLQQSNQALENFSYTAAHELRNPLGTVTGSLDLLARSPLLDKQQRLVQLGMRTAKSMNQMLTALLDYGKVQSKRDQFETVDMNEVVELSMTVLQALIKKTQAKVTWADLPKVYGNHQLLIQLVSNLVKNAIVHNTVTAPKVTISAEDQPSNGRQPSRWLFSVYDNGPGISPENQEKIFSMFYRASSQTNGSGLGLALCHRVVELHYGNIGTRSQPDGGSEFYFDLPKDSSYLP